MSVRASRYLHRANESQEMSSPAPNEIISVKTEPLNLRRRRIMRTGDLFHFDLDSTPENEKKVVSRTKSIDEDKSQKKRVKTPFRSVRKVKTSVAPDSSQKKRKSVLSHSCSQGKNVGLKEWEESVNPTIGTFNLDIESPSTEENLQKSTTPSIKKNAYITPHSSVVSSSKRSSCVTPNSLPKLIRRSVNNNAIGYRISGVKLSKSTDADSVEVENGTLVLDNPDYSQAESHLVENTQKRKSSDSPFKNNKKIKTDTTPNKFKVDSPTKGQNTVIIHQSLILKKASPLVEPNETEKTNVQKSSERRSLPVENAQPKRKIVKAKRFLNRTANQSNSNESAINIVSEVQTSLKKKRKTWQKQNNFDLDSFCETNSAEYKDKENNVEAVAESDGGEKAEDEDKTSEVKENGGGELDTTTEIARTNEETGLIDESEAKHAKEMEVIEIIDLVGEPSPCPEERKQKINSTFELVVTTCEEPISPSTTNPDPQLSNKSLSPIADLLHFDSSEEEIQPSTSGLVPETTSRRRRTYELQESVNDVSVLKTVSEQDSVRINSSSSTDLPLSDAAVTRSKITLRRRIDNNDEDFFTSRISKITPPWLTEDDFNSEEKSSPETSTPMPAPKGRFTLLKEVLTKKEPVFLDFNRKMSTSLMNNETKDIQNFAGKKKQTPHILLKKASSTKKYGSNVKIPNFAAIHKRALDKVENISEYKKRKEERAQMLLSGKKPPTSQTPKKQTRKQLRFDPGTSDNPKPLNFIPLPSTPLPKHVFNKSLDKTITPVEIRVPEFKFVASKENLFSIPRRDTPKIKEKSNTSKSNVAQVKVLTPKNNNVKEAFRFGNNGNRFGFKMAKPAAVMKKEEAKTMIATKSKMVKNVVESRRVMIKGVRSNRRFELLMGMRKGK